MSRSRKKNPIISWACCGRKALKFYKTLSRRRIRRIEPDTDDLKSGAIFKRMEERFFWPDDGRQRMDVEEDNGKWVRK